MNKTPETWIKTDQPNLVKLSDGFQFPIEHFLQALTTDHHILLYSPSNEKPLSLEERRALVSRTDTVITFDPDSYEKKVQIIQNDINPSDIGHLRLVQTWYWDERRARLAVCLDSMG